MKTYIVEITSTFNKDCYILNEKKPLPRITHISQVFETNGLKNAQAFMHGMMESAHLTAIHLDKWAQVFCTNFDDKHYNITTITDSGNDTITEVDYYILSKEEFETEIFDKRHYSEMFPIAQYTSSEEIDCMCDDIFIAYDRNWAKANDCLELHKDNYEHYFYRI